MPVASCLIAVVCAATLASCQPPPDPARSFAVVFGVESDPGVRLSGVHVLVNGDPVGESDSNGLVRTHIYGNPGQRLRINHDCPDGHEAPSLPKILRLRNFEGIDRSDPPEMEIILRCQPVDRLAVFIVRAKNGPDLPVLLDGPSVARTNGAGVAHFSIRGAPGTEYVVQLDTREHSGLLPQLPMHLFTLADVDEIFVINQSFDAENEPRRRGHRRTRITKIE